MGGDRKQVSRRQSATSKSSTCIGKCGHFLSTRLPFYGCNDISGRKSLLIWERKGPQKSEGYAMMTDGYVKDIEVVKFDTPGYFAIKSKVLPRTREKDPVTGARFYYPWVVITSVDADKRSCVLSAYCTCKGGIDGCCRHVLATLYEVIDFRDDGSKESATSGPCLWVRRATSQQASLLTDIVVTSNNNLTSLRPIEGIYQPLPETMLPPVESILGDIRQHLPGSVFLYAWEEQPKEAPLTTPPLTVSTPLEWIDHFKETHSCQRFQCKEPGDCATHFLHMMSWATEEQELIEEQTRGQHKNQNWHNMRKGLVTASNVKKICHSTDHSRTAKALLENSFSSTENRPLPEAIRFGRDNERRALRLFVRSHRYRHRQCSFQQPGLVVSTSEPYLAASPDAIVECKHSQCGKFLVEVKCLYRHRNFHPKLAIKERDFTIQGPDGKLYLKQNHEYFYQVQCQMAVTGIQSCYLCVYTKKGVEAIEVRYDPVFLAYCQSKTEFFLETTHVSHAFGNGKVKLQTDTKSFNFFLILCVTQMNMI